MLMAHFQKVRHCYPIPPGLFVLLLIAHDFKVRHCYRDAYGAHPKSAPLLSVYLVTPPRTHLSPHHSHRHTTKSRRALTLSPPSPATAPRAPRLQRPLRPPSPPSDTPAGDAPLSRALPPPRYARAALPCLFRRIPPPQRGRAPPPRRHSSTSLSPGISSPLLYFFNTPTC